MLTLLNNWTSELDKARAWAKEEQKRLSKRLRNATGINSPLWKLKSKDLKPYRDSMALTKRGNPTPSINLRDCADERSVWPCNSKHMRHDMCVMKTEEWTEWLAERFMEWVVGAMVESLEIKLAEIVCNVSAPLVWLACTWTPCGVVITACCVKRVFGKPTKRPT